MDKMILQTFNYTVYNMTEHDKIPFLLNIQINIRIGLECRFS